MVFIHGEGAGCHQRVCGQECIKRKGSRRECDGVGGAQRSHALLPVASQRLALARDDLRKVRSLERAQLVWRPQHGQMLALLQ